MDSNATWSILAERPVVYYNEHLSTLMCCWDGVTMTRQIAMAMLLFKIESIPIRRDFLPEFYRLRALGAFDGQFHSSALFESNEQLLSEFWYMISDTRRAELRTHKIAELLEMLDYQEWP